MNPEVKISIIIIGYNGKRYLENCISSILDQETNDLYEVIFVDNSSKDGSIDFVKKFPSVKVIGLDKNLGYYESFNYIAQTYAQGKYLLPLPQDTIMHRKCLKELVTAADADEKTMICLVNTINPGYPDYSKKEREKEVKWVYLMSTTKVGVTLPKKWPFQQKLIPILAYSGVTALIKKEILSISGQYFDSSISHFLGDVELGVRMNVLGYKAILVPSAIVYHIEDNKSWFDRKLLSRAIIGSRDTYIVYFKNMYALEYLAFLPLLFIGTPIKVFALRVSWFTKTILFVLACIVNPFVFLWALTQFQRHQSKRKKNLAKRIYGRFWLLETIVTGRLK